MKEECHYCGGSRRIHLYPNYRSLSVVITEDLPGMIEAKDYRIYKDEAVDSLTEAYKIVVKERELMKEVKDADRHSPTRDTRS